MVNYVKYIVATFVGLTTLVGCFKNSSTDTDTLVFCAEGSPSTFNPQIAIDGTTLNASSRTVYNRMFDFKPGTTELIPSLAKSWTISPDGLEYTIRLRENVHFHTTPFFKPTRDFNAEDVVFSFQRMRDRSHNFHTVGGGSYEYFKSMGLDTLIKDIVVIDPHTIRFTLTRPEAPFITSLAMDFTSIFSKEYAESLKKDELKNLDEFPVGTGPFIFLNYEKDKLIKYKANKDHFLYPPKYEWLHIQIIGDADKRTEKLKNRECHIINEPDPRHLGQLEKSSGIRVVRKQGMNTGYIGMNVTWGPFKKRKVRQAMNYAMNRQEYIKDIYLGNAQVAHSAFPPIIWGYESRVRKYKYDPEKAKQLLVEAGYKDGFEFTLAYLPISRPYGPDGKKMADLIRRDLSNIGIETKLITYDWQTYLAKARNGQHEAVMLGWTGDNADPDNFLSQLLSCEAVSGGSNISQWCNKEFSELVAAAKKVIQFGARIKYYKKAQKIFSEEVPWVPIAHSEIFRAHLDSVKGYELNPMGTENFHLIEIE